MAPPSSSPGVHVLDRIRVSPPPPPDSALPLTFFDVAWFFTGPVERLFFYRHPDPASALPLLRSSLAVALRRFYPLAGTIRSHPPFLCSYTPGADALTLVVAESDSPDEFDRIVARSPRDLAGIRPLVPQLPPPGEDGAFALAAVQATVFPGRGLCLGVSVHHAACDDASTMQFVRTWAAACRLGLESDDGSEDAALPPRPVLDRSLVADPDDLRGKTLAGMARLAPPPPPPLLPPCVPLPRAPTPRGPPLRRTTPPLRPSAAIWRPRPVRRQRQPGGPDQRGILWRGEGSAAELSPARRRRDLL